MSNTEPTPGAMRAADTIRYGWRSLSREDMARIIDRELVSEREILFGGVTDLLDASMKTLLQLRRAGLISFEKKERVRVGHHPYDDLDAEDKAALVESARRLMRDAEAKGPADPRDQLKGMSPAQQANEINDVEE